MKVTASVNLDLRHSFTFQFLEGARMFASEATLIEEQQFDGSDELRTRHRALVSTAIMQSVAALEAEAYEVANHGPGHHLGSNGIDGAARDFIVPLSDMIDRLSIIDRFQKILYLAHKPMLNPGGIIMENIDLAVKLRNEITHYKSKWGSQTDREKLVMRLREKKFRLPPFVSEESLFFPHQVLGAACANWCVDSAVAFLAEFCSKLGFPCRMNQFTN